MAFREVTSRDQHCRIDSNRQQDPSHLIEMTGFAEESLPRGT